MGVLDKTIGCAVLASHADEGFPQTTTPWKLVACGINFTRSHASDSLFLPVSRRYLACQARGRSAFLLDPTGTLTIFAGVYLASVYQNNCNSRRLTYLRQRSRIVWSIALISPLSGIDHMFAGGDKAFLSKEMDSMPVYSVTMGLVSYILQLYLCARARRMKAGIRNWLEGVTIPDDKQGQDQVPGTENGKFNQSSISELFFGEIIQHRRATAKTEAQMPPWTVRTFDLDGRIPGGLHGMCG